MVFSMGGIAAAAWASQSVAVPAVTTLGYAGILSGPAAIGIMVCRTGLVAAFLYGSLHRCQTLRSANRYSTTPQVRQIERDLT